jgi:sulfopyruvate decarboxylase TPP-binding subunit
LPNHKSTDRAFEIPSHFTGASCPKQLAKSAASRHDIVALAFRAPTKDGRMDLPAEKVAQTLIELGFTHVVWLPDSTIGPWEHALESSGSLTLVRVCREGEAWAIAAGLHLGGQRPLVMIQNTGLFESGDAMRNVLFDLRLPLLALVGYRSFLIAGSADSARRFTEPILDAWGLDYVLIREPGELPLMAEHFRACRAAGRPGVTLVAEGRM